MRKLILIIKIITIYLHFLAPVSSEIINKIIVSGNERISSSTVKMFSGIQVNEDISSNFVWIPSSEIRISEFNTDQSSSKTVRQESSAKSELWKSTSETLWTAFSQDESQNLPQLFPERRRALGQIFSKVLENAKGAQLNYLASLGLSDRWLDELHYLYAGMLIKRDQRVQALKVLNATEEAKAGSRLQGRNRLPRLLLSSYNQLKMGRYRVSAKYFQRLKAKIPA